MKTASKLPDLLNQKIFKHDANNMLDMRKIYIVL